MKKILPILFILILVPVAKAQTTGKKNYFAVGLFASAQSSMITYAVVTYRDDVFIGAQVMTEQRFMYEIMGYYPSIATINRENLLQKNEVDSCFLIENEARKIVGYYAKPFADLWRIRFFTHPMQYDQDGWSQGEFKPSRWQREYLGKEYGVNNVLMEYFYGDNLYKLLRDVQNPDWIFNYHFMTADTTASVSNTGQP